MDGDSITDKKNNHKQKSVGNLTGRRWERGQGGDINVKS